MQSGGGIKTELSRMQSLRYTCKVSGTKCKNGNLKTLARIATHMTSTQEIVQRLWSLCHVLRDDGITFHEYVTELTYLLS